MPRPLSRCLWLTALALVGLAGCDRDEIHTYTAPKPPPSHRGTVASKVRLLAAIFVEAKKNQWFFKLGGPVDDVNKLADDFEKYLDSIRFNDKNAEMPLDWTLPAGWVFEKAPPGGSRWATIYPVGKGKKPEITISRFGQLSPNLDNVNRWARQDVGRPPLAEETLHEVAKLKKAGPHEYLLVDMTGPGPGPMAGHPPMKGKGGVRPGASKGRQPFTATAQEGWTELAGQGGPFAAFKTFAIRDGESSALLKITTLGSFGNLLANIARWRDEVGLPDIQKVEPKPTTIKVDGNDADFYDLIGPAGPGQKRSLLVVANRKDGTWFFKLIGDADVVGKNRDKFNAYIQSIKFTGAADE